MSSRVTDKDLEETLEKYSDTLYKICFLILKNEYDVKDVLQETFIKYMTKAPQFESEDHKKAWLVTYSHHFRFAKKWGLLVRAI